MKAHFKNQVLASFYLWAENRYLNQQSAYINYTSRLYPQTEQVPYGYVAYAAPFKQWVYDSGVAGATIMDTISGDISLARGQSGMKVDYDNGRVLIPTGLGLSTGANITGSYAFKEVNIYQSNQTQDQLLTQERFYINPRFHSTPTGTPPPYAETAPAIFVTALKNDNKPWALGGTDMCHYNMSMAIYTETPYQLSTLLGNFSDAARSYIPILDIADDPIDELGDTKSGYNYLTLRNLRGTPGNLMLINDVRTATISDVMMRVNLNQTLYRGLVDMDVSFPRQTANLFP
jgi:hypothetical protein